MNMLKPDEKRSLDGLRKEIAALNNVLSKVVTQQEESAKDRRQQPIDKTPDGPISSNATKQSDGTSQPSVDTANRMAGPNPWLEFAIQCALCLFTLGAFLAAAYYAYTADKTLTSIPLSPP